MVQSLFLNMGTYIYLYTNKLKMLSSIGPVQRGGDAWNKDLEKIGLY